MLRRYIRTQIWTMPANSRRRSRPASVSASVSSESIRDVETQRGRHAGPAVPGWTLPLPNDAWDLIAKELVLTHRETEIVRCVLDNLDVHDIAARFSITTRTVRAHLEHVYRKLGLRTRCDLILLVFAASLERDRPALMPR